MTGEPAESTGRARSTLAVAFKKHRTGRVDELAARPGGDAQPGKLPAQLAHQIEAPAKVMRHDLKEDKLVEEPPRPAFLGGAGLLEPGRDHFWPRVFAGVVRQEFAEVVPLVEDVEDQGGHRVKAE